MNSEKSGIQFDIHFSTITGEGYRGFRIKGLSKIGEEFLRNSHGKWAAEIYTSALEAGLHVSFEDTQTRDAVIV
jgi:hypothetical protein